jgi:hypothetical protein
MRWVAHREKRYSIVVKKMEVEKLEWGRGTCILGVLKGHHCLKA